MPRTPARVTQADVARVIRAAKQEGAHAIEVKPDGTLLIQIASTNPGDLESADCAEKPIVL